MELPHDHLVHSPSTMAPDPLSPHGHDSANSLPSQPEMPFASSAAQANRRRKSSKSSVIKRSASTPNVRGLAAAETAASLAEKRRNKLGYHRTSVACVHCRRRKIRCLLAHEDHQNRCSNCIRLKKECNFFPVDQQPSIDRRPRAGSKADAGSGETSASSSSSPGFAPGHIVDQGDHFASYAMPLGGHAFHGSMPPMGAAVLSPPQSAAPMESRAFEFPPPHDRGSWDSHYYDHSVSSHANSMHEDHGNGFWKPVESPITPGFSPYHSLQPRGDGSWPILSRSLSFGNVDDRPHHAVEQYQQPYQQDLRRRPAEMLPPSLQNNANPPNGSMTDVVSVTMPPIASTQPIYQYGLPPAWNMAPGPQMMAKPAEFGTWYGEPGQLARVQEEDLGTHFGQDPSILYASAGHH